MAALAFAGAAIYSLSQRQNQDERICNAVKGLRDDLVEALTKIESRALAQAKPEQVHIIMDAYQGKDGLITIINNPQCP